MTSNTLASGNGSGWKAVGLPSLLNPSTLWNRAVVLATVFVLIYTLDLLTILLGDYWLLQELGMESVFWTNFSMGAKLYIPTLLVFAAAGVWPVYFHRTGSAGKAWAISPAILVATVAALGLAMEYDAFLLGSQEVSYDQLDPIFGLDLGFYVFTLPWIWTLWDFVLYLALVMLAFSVMPAFVQDRLSNPDTSSRRITQRIGVLSTLPVRLSVLAVGLVLSFGEWLTRYDMLTKDNTDSSVYAGAAYVDITGFLTNLNYIYVQTLVMIGISVVLFLVLGALQERAKADSIESANKTQVRKLVVIAACLLLADFAFKGAVELRDALFVKPNEPVIQLESIKNHIQATRRGAHLSDIERIEYRPNTPGAPLPAINEILDDPAVRNIPLWPGFSSYLERLLDPQHANRVLLPGGDNQIYGPSLEATQQAQKLRAYYRFMGVDFARYDIDGEQRMVVSSVRELPLYEPEPWLGYFGQRYMLYTHGFGMTIAPANEVTAEGSMNFVSKNIPGEFAWEEIALENERVYYGEGAATMAFSNVDRMQELDYPTDQDRATIFLPDEQTTAVAADTFMKRLVFGWRSGHFIEFLFSDLITDKTRVHFYRRPIERLQRVAPFLYYDTNAYAVSAEGRVQWMVNGMSTSNSFPYARRMELGDKSDQRSPYPVTHRFVNYFEDSVKAVVDGFSGEVTLYKISDEPVIETWAQIYPEMFTDVSKMPESLRSQLTYPSHMFHSQFDDMWIYYHMEDPMYFFNQEDMWDDADEVLGPIITDGHGIRFSIEPYPLIMKTGGLLPESDGVTQYSQLLVFTPEKALNLRGIPFVYQDWPNYGKLGVLEVPKGTYVMGPEQADSLIDQDPVISSQFALWNRRGLDVIRGHTITIPLANEVIYAEPIFLRSRQNRVTQLQKVAVVFRDRVAMGDSFEEALRAIYGQINGVTASVELPLEGSQVALGDNSARHNLRNQ